MLAPPGQPFRLGTVAMRELCLQEPRDFLKANTKYVFLVDPGINEAKGMIIITTRAKSAAQ